MIVPIVLIILGLIFRVGWQKAVRGGVITGIGLAGLFLVVNLIISALQPAVPGPGHPDGCRQGSGRRQLG